MRTAAIYDSIVFWRVDSLVIWNGSKHPQVLYSSSLHSVYKLIVFGAFWNTWLVATSFPFPVLLGAGSRLIERDKFVQAKE